MFKKGNKIGAVGRPRGQTIRAKLKSIAAEEIIIDGTKTTKGEVILRQIVNGAMKADPVQQKYFLEYMYGKPKQEVDIDVDVKAKVVAIAAQYTPEVQEFSRRLLSNPDAYIPAQLMEDGDATNEEG